MLARQHGRQVRQPGADDDERQAALGDLVARRAERRHVVGAEVLHLVDEDRDAPAHVGGQAADVGEQLDQVDLDVAGVGPAGDGGGVDAGLPAVAQLGAGGRRRAGAKALMTPSTWSTSSAVRVARARAPPGAAPPPAAAAAAGPGRASSLPVPQSAPHGGRAQGVEQHRLADAAQPGEHDRALRPAVRDALEHDVEGAQLVVTAGELGRALAGAGGVRVSDRVHDGSVWGLLA